MGALDGRVAVITGAGRGIGREHALLFAAEGAKVVVNDLGGSPSGDGSDAGPAQEVANEIVAAGGEAIANTDDIADRDGAQRLINSAVEHFGALHVLVNNAGILRDRMMVNMSDEEWDLVIRVHLRGHFMTSAVAGSYWRGLAKAGTPLKASIINTSSTSGLFNNPGQTNYGAAKTGIATFSIIADQELSRYGVRVNAIAPAAMTRLTGLGRPEAAEPPSAEWTPMHPGNVSPFVAYLATADCPIHGRVFFVQGGEVYLFQPFVIVDEIKKDGDFWTVEELQVQGAKFQDYEFDYGHPLGNMLFRGPAAASGG
jgi:NAD(P)-dependent dehydrogenase (short-subunit alcohol dehydrogenase family)